MSLFISDGDVIAHGEAFLRCTLPKAHWTHEGHFAAALYLIARRPDIAVARQMPDLIRRYNEATGVANTADAGYHETITQASLIAARALLAGRPHGEDLHLTVHALMAGPLGDKAWLEAHYTRPLLFSRQARATWVEPDLAPLSDLRLD